MKDHENLMKSVERFAAAVEKTQLKNTPGEQYVEKTTADILDLLATGLTDRATLSLITGYNNIIVGCREIIISPEGTVVSKPTDTKGIRSRLA
jgi:hypothetical protein